jgi:hypothetical protein
MKTSNGDTVGQVIEEAMAQVCLFLTIDRKIFIEQSCYLSGSMRRSLNVNQVV